MLHNGDNHSFFGESGQGLCGYCLRFQPSSGKEGNGHGTVGGKSFTGKKGGEAFKKMVSGGKR